jgi:hypothetical protein
VKEDSLHLVQRSRVGALSCTVFGKFTNVGDPSMGFTAV